MLKTKRAAKMSKKAVGCYSILALVFIITTAFGFRTPVSGEAQMIGKVFLMLCICYFVVFGLIGMMQVTSKKIGFKSFVAKFAVLITFISSCILLLNLPFDYFMVFLDKHERYIPSSGCAIIAFTLLALTMIGHTVIHEKVKEACKKPK